MKKDSEIILKKIYELRDNPLDILKIAREKLWRLNYGLSGSCRVIISMNKIIVVRIGHRKNVYSKSLLGQKWG